MITKQKIKQILKYVWNSNLQSSNTDFDMITNSIISLLENDSDTIKISEFLFDISVNIYNTSISPEKCDQTAKLIMDWYSPVPPIKTDYGLIRIKSAGTYYTELTYKNTDQKISLMLNMTIYHEAILHPENIPFEGEEKKQLLQAIESLVNSKQLLIYSEKTAEYIDKNIAFW